jgi:hypothetical protein
MVIVEGKFAGQDDCLDVWAVAGEVEELIWIASPND